MKLTRIRHGVTEHVEREIVVTRRLVVAHIINIRKPEIVKPRLVFLIGRVEIRLIGFLHLHGKKLSVGIIALRHARRFAVDRHRYVGKSRQIILTAVHLAVDYARRLRNALNVADNARIFSAFYKPDFERFPYRKGFILAHFDRNVDPLEPVICIDGHVSFRFGIRRNGRHGEPCREKYRKKKDNR